MNRATNFRMAVLAVFLLLPLMSGPAFCQDIWVKGKSIIDPEGQKAAENSYKQAPKPVFRQKPVVAVVLSGGSAFGMAHAGVLEAIEEAGIPIDMVIGTSMGSIVGGLYASGYSPSQMEELVTTMDWGALFTEMRETTSDRYERSIEQAYGVRSGFDRNGLRIIGHGLISGQNVLSEFTSAALHMLTRRDFNSFPVVYRAVAADVVTGEKIVIDHGSIAEAMRSSMSISGVFSPYELEGRRLVDGGMIDNLPVDVARELGADIVIAVESRGSDLKSYGDIKNALGVANQTINDMMLYNMRPNRRDADIFIKCDMTGFSSASFTEAAGIIEAGRKAGIAALPTLRELAAKIAGQRALVTPDRQANRAAMAPEPAISSLRIEGNLDAAKTAMIHQKLDGFVNAAYTRDSLRRAVDALYAQGYFESIHLDLEAGPEGRGSTAIIRAKALNRAENTVFAGLDYESVFSSTFSSQLYMTGGLLLRGLTGPGSALFISSSLVNRLKISAEYFQPLGPFFIKPWARYAYEYSDIVAEDSPVTVGMIYRSMGGGLWLGCNIGNKADFMAGFSYENVILPENFLAEEKSSIVMGPELSLRINTSDSTIFPRKGFDLTLYGSLCDERLGATENMLQTDITLRGGLPIGKSDSLGLCFFAGTDFDYLLPAFEPSAAYWYSLNRPGMFYGLASTASENICENITAFSAEYRRRLGSVNTFIGGDVYAIANLSAAGLFVFNTDENNNIATTVTVPVSLSLGLGSRLSSSFGAYLLGSVNTRDGSYSSVGISLSFGSFHERVEDRR